MMPLNNTTTQLSLPLILEDIPSKSIEYRLLSENQAYCVGSDGTVWTRLKKINPNINGHCVGVKYAFREWRLLHLSKNRTGYPRAAIYQNGKQHKIMVHLLVLETFIGARPLGMVACHYDDIKANCRLQNLRWDYPNNNWADRKRNGIGIHLQYDNHHKAKVTSEQVINIRLLAQQGVSSTKLAEEYRVSHGAIRCIVLRKTWRHV